MGTKELKTQEKQQEKKKLTSPTHNSLQHDPEISMPLLSLLVEALKKENKEEIRKKEEETNEGISLESIAETEESIEQEETEEEKKKKWKDPIVALAERIKQFYANEMLQQAYQAERNYHANAQYNNDRTAKMQTMMKAAYDQEEYGLTASEKQKLPKALTDENSIGYKLSKGDKYQTFIMTDPRGRLHSTWEIVRIMNESNEGTLERNDGLHYQGLS